MVKNSAFYRTRRAYKNARSKLDQVQKTNGDNKKLVHKLSQILREYIRDKLNLPGAAFTSMEVESKLRDRSLPKNQIERIVHILEKYESLQYGMKENESMDELINESSEILIQLEKQT